MEEVQDLFGKLCRHYFDTGKSSELKLQLSNGVIMNDFPIPFYVDAKELRGLEKKFLEYTKGRVLDIGCGPGRVGLILKKRGLEVIGVDISPSMIYIAQKRGLNACLMDVNKELPEGSFDTVIMFGNGFGLPGSIKNIESFLQRAYSLTSVNALVIAESNDPNRMTNQIDLDYQERNRKLGRYVGQRVWRYVSGNKIDKLQSWVQVEPDLLQRIATKTNWKIHNGPEYEQDSQWGAYFFTLEKL